MLVCLRKEAEGEHSNSVVTPRSVQRGEEHLTVLQIVDCKLWEA